MPFIDYHQQLFYQAKGEGVPVVLLHGFCEDHSVWQFLFDAVSGCQLISLDLPGFGQSGVALTPDLSHMADLVALLLRKMDIEKCILIGHSMGGYISLAFAEKYGHMLKGLGLVHSSPYADTAEKKDKRTKEQKFIRSNGHQLYVAQLIPKLFASTFGDNAVINQLVTNAQAYTVEGIIDGLEAMKRRPDRSEILRQLKCPVLCLAGKEDIVVSLEKSLAFACLPERSMMHFLPQVGHMGMFEATEKCREIITEFISLCR